VVDGETFALQLLPSGILYPYITPVIGNGVVVDPAVLLDEVDALTATVTRFDGWTLGTGAEKCIAYVNVMVDSAKASDIRA
jgi:adenylosuccinate synthase